MPVPREPGDVPPPPPRPSPPRPAPPPPPVPRPPYTPPHSAPSTPASLGWRANYASGILSEISAVLELFQFATGYVWNANQVDQAEQALAQSGLYSQGDKAFASLFGRLSADQQKTMPWAEFGLGETDYLDKAGKAKANWYDLTGQDMPHDVLSQYISNNWTQAQLQQFAQKDPTLTVQQPWLLSGQSFLQTSEAFINAYGHAPADPSTLSGWFRFRQSAQQIGTGRPTTQQLTQQAQVRQRDVEVR
jgi:hypothetical protein